MFRFQYLDIWKRSFVLVQKILKISEALPTRYRFSLSEQLVRAGLSVINNISEGSGRVTKKDQNYFYSVARGSLLEVINMLLLVRELDIIDSTKIRRLLVEGEEITKMIYGFMSKNR